MNALTRLLLITLLAATTASRAADPGAPLKVLFLTGGGYHDYKALAPHLTNHLGELAHATFEVRWDMNSLRDPKFAEGFDAVVYDVCFDNVEDAILQNALNTVRAGKPAVMIHCAVHAFRNSPKIHEWEACCGMRSKVHDRYEGFTVTKLDPSSPITKAFPQTFETAGDELYQTISIPPESHQLLRAKSPVDGREHIVCWTSEYGKGRVFATTLGHDMKTASRPEYLRLVANGLLWACGKPLPETGK
jgi:type 1 glutamine amidotransferase